MGSIKLYLDPLNNNIDTFKVHNKFNDPKSKIKLTSQKNLSQTKLPKENLRTNNTKQTPCKTYKIKIKI